MTPLWLATIAASIGAGVIHLALGPKHVDELGGLGFGFYLAAILQVGWASAAVLAFHTARHVAAADSIGDGPFHRGAIIEDPARRRLANVGIATNAAILAAWAVSRLFGLPGGETPWVPEGIGRADAISAALQGAIVFMLARSRGRPSAIAPGVARPAGMRRGAILAAATLLVIGASTAVGLLPGGHAHAAGHGHAAGSGDEAHAGTGAQDVVPHVDPRGGARTEAESPLLPTSRPASPGPTDAGPKPSDGHPHEPGEPDHDH